jgi:hypothetical protein
MSPIFDSFGTWDNLGTITLGLDWQTFPKTAVAPKILRFTYLYDFNEWENSAKYKSYAIARFNYPLVNPTVSPSFRLYPKPEQEIRYFANTQPLVDFQAKKILYPRRRFANIEAIIVRLQIEAVIDD